MQLDSRQLSDKKLITLLEHLHHHNVHHCEELAEYRGAVTGSGAGELLAEAVDAIVALKGGE